MIDGFCDFYDRISDEALSIFERALSNGAQFSIITFDEMKRIKEYRDTGLYSHLVRCENGVVVGGGIDDSLISELSSQLYSIPVEARKRTMLGNQAIVYSGEKISYIDVGRE